MIVIGAGASAWFTYQSAYEARRQANIAQRSLIATSRPWLQIEPEPTVVYLSHMTNEVKVNEHGFPDYSDRRGVTSVGTAGRPFSLNFPGHAVVGVKLSLKVYGNSPALNIRPRLLWLDQSPFGRPDSDARNVVKMACADGGVLSGQAMSVYDAGSVAPGEEYQLYIDTIFPSKSEPSLVYGPDSYSVGGTLALCVSYSALGDENLHQLIRIYEFGAPDPIFGFMSSIEIGAVKQPSDLKLHREYGLDASD